MTSSKKMMALLTLSLLLWGTHAFAAERKGAIAATQARRAASEATAEKLGAGGPGSDLKAIASPKKAATTFTGFPAGTLPGGEKGEKSENASQSSGSAPAPGRVVLSGDPLEPLIGASHVGLSLDRICTMADHVGYVLVLRARYRPSALDAPYSYSLMKGRRRIATLFFNRSLKLASIE